MPTAEERPRWAAARSWGWFLARRLGLLILVLCAVCVLTFTVTRFTGTPLYASIGQQATPEMIEARAEVLGLNDPVWVQFRTYFFNLLRGDLGTSRRTFVPVAQEIGDRLPATGELVVLATFFIVLWTVPLGVRAGLKGGGAAARIGEGISQFGVSVPAFWLGLLLIFLLVFLWPIFPPPLGRLSGADPPAAVTGLYTVDAALAGDFGLSLRALWHLTLPAVTLAVTSGPPVFRVTRSAVAAVASSPYVEAARSYGLPRRLIMRRDIARNAFPPVLNLVAMTFGYLIGGAVLVEVVFSWPGIGHYAVRAMDFSDYDAVLGVVLVSAAIYVFLYFIVDLAQYALDPRLRD